MLLQDPSGFLSPKEKPKLPVAERTTGAAARTRGRRLVKRIVSPADKEMVGRVIGKSTKIGKRGDLVTARSLKLER